MLSCWAEGCFRGDCAGSHLCLKVEEDRTYPLVFVALLNLHNTLKSFMLHMTVY